MTTSSVFGKSKVYLEFVQLKKNILKEEGKQKEDTQRRLDGLWQQLTPGERDAFKLEVIN